MATRKTPAPRRGTAKKAAAKTAKRTARAIVDAAHAERRNLTAEEQEIVSADPAEQRRYETEHPGVTVRSRARKVASLGRIVLVHADDSLTPEVGIVVGSKNQPDGNVDLFVFGANGARRVSNLPYSEEPKAGTYSWPPFVPDVVEVIGEGVE